MESPHLDLSLYIKGITLDLININKFSYRARGLTGLIIACTERISSVVQEAFISIVQKLQGTKDL